MRTDILQKPLGEGKAMKAGRNERTSARVARIAGRILQDLKDVPDSSIVWIAGPQGSAKFRAGDLKALSASALTQTKDRKAKK